jgi:sortase A
MLRRSQRVVVTAIVTLSGLAAACGDDPSETSQLGSTYAMLEPTTTAVAPTTATAAPSTTHARPSTTELPTTTTLALPVPADAPDPGLVEPEVQLAALEIPKIGIAVTMFEGVTLGTLDRGPGHWPGSALPGEIGNVVIAGHRMSHDHPFRDIDQLVEGDEVVLTDGTGRHVYRVVRTEIVNPDAMWILSQSPARTATLFACHPKGSTRQRIVVHLELSSSAAA